MGLDAGGPFGLNGGAARLGLILPARFHQGANLLALAIARSLEVIALANERPAAAVELVEAIERLHRKASLAEFSCYEVEIGSHKIYVEHTQSPFMAE